MKGTTMKGNVADKGSLLMKSPVKAPLAMGKQGNQGKTEIGKVQQGQRQYLHSTNASPMVKAMSELEKVKKKLMTVEGKLDARAVEMNAMKRRMQRLEVMVDSLQAGSQENVQGGTGGRLRGLKGRNLDTWQRRRTTAHGMDWRARTNPRGPHGNMWCVPMEAECSAMRGER
jgi:hypothetical protein